MHTPSNLPSSSNRGAFREDAPLRLQSSGLFTRSPRKANPAHALAPPPFICLSVEPEDAKMTGATRSLSRRLLALNIRHDS